MWGINGGIKEGDQHTEGIRKNEVGMQIGLGRTRGELLPLLVWSHAPGDILHREKATGERAAGH